ncbi:MAG: ribonuclease P protein component [Candidatus Dasytiphilus stammeri]
MNYYKFPKKLRLLKSKDFNLVLQQSMKINRSPIILYYCRNHYKFARLGLIINKYNIPLAYQRNRIKRLIRESFRLNQNELPSMDFVIIIKKKVDLMKNQKIVEILQTVWEECYFIASKKC